MRDTHMNGEYWCDDAKTNGYSSSVSELYRRQRNERDRATWKSSGCWNGITVYSDGNIRVVWYERNRGNHFERKKELKKSWLRQTAALSKDRLLTNIQGNHQGRPRFVKELTQLYL